MDTKQLESMLEGARETQRVEFKNSMEWDVKLFAKHILALANVQDGGYIIVGVEDMTWERKGVTQKQKKTYKHDIMRDQMAVFADPYVDFDVEFVKDKGGRLLYVVIEVYETEELPIICKKDSNKTQEGILYYRNRNKKIESARISNSADMRDVILRSVVRLTQKQEKFGFVVKNNVDKQFNEELQDL